MLDVWITTQTPTNERTGHPTQKPISLIRKIIEVSSNKKDIVLDPFLGSGTTAVACKQLEREYLGYEIDPQYFKIATRRLNQKNLMEAI